MGALGCSVALSYKVHFSSVPLLKVLSGFDQCTLIIPQHDTSVCNNFIVCAFLQLASDLYFPLHSLASSYTNLQRRVEKCGYFNLESEYLFVYTICHFIIK
jgi:hypothetical protein